MKKLTRYTLFAGTLFLSVSLNAAELSPDIAISKCGKEIPYSRMIPASAGPIEVQYDTSGMRKISPVPAPGIHPRMFHSPEDRDMLRRIYKETPGGKYIWDLAMTWTRKLKGEIKRSDYPKNEHGQLIGPFSRGGWDEPADDYKKLLAGEYHILDGRNLMNDQALALLCLEIYRCWIEDDREAGKEAVTVLAGIAAHLAKTYKSGQFVGKMGAYHVGLGYDYGYNFMTPEQRETLRNLIARASRNKAHYGAFTDCDTTTSNWLTLDSFMPMTLMAIEGEEGFNENYYKGFVEAYKKFITYGWYKSGVPYEGLGKNYQFNATMIILAKRGVPLVGHPHVRAYAEQFLPAIALPAGTGFLATDDWGGTGGDTVHGNYRFNIADMVGLKWLFPNSRKVDYVWQVYFGATYEKGVDIRPTGYYPALLMALMFPLEQHDSGITRGDIDAPLTLFGPERGYLLTRSGTDPDAAFLSLHCRQDKGGHTSADRNNFVFAALGRLWGYQMNIAGGSRFGKVNETRFFSSVVIDNVGQCGKASGCFPVPGKMVDYHDSADITYATGDAKYAYDWEWNWNNAGDPNVDSRLLEQGWTKVTETPNDFQFVKQPYAYMDKPFYMQSSWIHPGTVEHYVKRPWNPVQKAFRTAALIRGNPSTTSTGSGQAGSGQGHPYALIVDDIRKDDKKRNYKWLMQAPRDLRILEFGFDPTGKDPITDVTLYGSEVAVGENLRPVLKKGDPLLLVKILQNENDMSEQRYTPIARLEEYMSNIRYPKATGKRFVIESYTEEPKFKILLLPYRYGQKKPEVKWLDSDLTRLSVIMGDQRDVVDFVTTEGGWTRLALKRQTVGK